MSSLSDDDDIPSFSDVETMILDEKLSEDEKSIYMNGIWSYRNLQTLKYANPNFQRRFIRLDQAANGYMKRDMSSWGAFAILQGWKFIYYVKKPQEGQQRMLLLMLIWEEKVLTVEYLDDRQLYIYIGRVFSI